MKAAKVIGEHIYIAGAAEKRIFKRLKKEMRRSCWWCYDTKLYRYYLPYGESDIERGEMERIPLVQVNCLDPDNIRIIGCAE